MWERSCRRALPPAILALAMAPALAAGALEQSVGRSEVRVFSVAYPLRVGLAVGDAGLADRLEARGYRRVRRRPERPGEFFWGHEVFWIYRRPYLRGGRTVPATLLELPLERSTGRVRALPEGIDAVLDPRLLAESLDGDRAPRRLLELGDLPEHLWRAVLAAEDARFFDHPGVDARALSRAALRNAQAGRVVQGGSTITQQLIKNRDLTPRRRLGRKVSEAMRALSLETEHSKEEILQAYLNSVYLGHVGGLAVHGVGTAARTWFGKPATRLGLGESALLAAMIQGPNRLHPGRHPEAALERQRWVLGRLEELGWVGADEVAAARRAGLPRLSIQRPEAPPARAFVRWVRESLGGRAQRRLEKGRGVVVETTLDPFLQRQAESAVRSALRRQRRAGRAPGAALVALDAFTGDVVAYVAGDPDDRADRFDRARQARRQPGSAIKPLVLLEAFADCGPRQPLYASRRVLDEPVRLDLPSGPWRPENFGRRYQGVVDLRQALVDSLNVPFVRVGRWCGFEPVAQRFRSAGLEVRPDPPPAVVLGAVETSPLAMATAFTAFARNGRVARARAWTRLRRPAGRGLERAGVDSRRVVDPASAYIVRDLLRDAVDRGTGGAAALDGAPAWGKTGTSSGGRDAWFVGGAGRLVTAVWLGVEGAAGGLRGGSDAAPVWRRFMERAAAAYPGPPPARPEAVVERWVEERTGLLVRRERGGARQELYRRGDAPPRRRLLRADVAQAALE